MAVSLAVKKVEIARLAHTSGTQKDRADVQVVIGGLGGPIEVTLGIFDFSSLDDAVEKARRTIYEFAVELTKAADQRPLR